MRGCEHKLGYRQKLSVFLIRPLNKYSTRLFEVRPVMRLQCSLCNASVIARGLQADITWLRLFAHTVFIKRAGPCQAAIFTAREWPPGETPNKEDPPRRYESRTSQCGVGAKPASAASR